MFREMSPRSLPASRAEGTRSDLRNRRKSSFINVAKYEIQLNLSRNIVSLQVLGRCLAFFTLRDQLVAQNICCGLKKAVAKSRARVYYEQQILALLLIFHQTRNLSWIHTKQINQSARCISSTRSKCFSCATS